jgi:hypothetical protein
MSFVRDSYRTRNFSFKFSINFKLKALAIDSIYSIGLLFTGLEETNKSAFPSKTIALKISTRQYVIFSSMADGFYKL